MFYNTCTLKNTKKKKENHYNVFWEYCGQHEKIVTTKKSFKNILYLRKFLTIA